MGAPQFDATSHLALSGQTSPLDLRLTAPPAVVWWTNLVPFCRSWRRVFPVVQDTDTSEAIDMRSVVTSSCTAPLGPDPPGFRVVRVFSRRIEHEYYDIEAPPQEVELGGEEG